MTVDRERIEADVRHSHMKGADPYRYSSELADHCEELLAALAGVEADNERLRATIRAAAIASEDFRLTACLEAALAFSRPGEENGMSAAVVAVEPPRRGGNPRA